MPNPLIVLDQNKLREDRSPELVHMLENEPETCFVLPDIAFIEMTKKSSSREETLMGSLRLLSRYPQRVRVARGVQDCLKVELATLIPTDRNLIHEEHTAHFVRLLQTVGGSGDNVGAEDLKRIVEDPNGVHAELAKFFFDHNANKARIRAVIDEMKEGLHKPVLKDLRASRLKREDWINIIHGLGNLFMKRFLLSRNAPLSAIQAFRECKPMMLREHYSTVWLGLDWIRAGGFDSVSPDKITNDTIDHDYVLTATYSDGLLSGDHRVNSAYDDLSAVLELPPDADV